MQTKKRASCMVLGTLCDIYIAHRWYAREEEEEREFEVGVVGDVGVFHEVRAGQAHENAQQDAENGRGHERRQRLQKDA